MYQKDEILQHPLVLHGEVLHNGTVFLIKLNLRLFFVVYFFLWKGLEENKLIFVFKDSLLLVVFSREDTFKILVFFLPFSQDSTWAYLFRMRQRVCINGRVSNGGNLRILGKGNRTGKRYLKKKKRFSDIFDFKIGVETQ